MKNFDESERRLLHYYAKGLKIDNTDLQNVQESAQDFILQQYLARVYGTGMTTQKRDVYIFCTKTRYSQRCCFEAS